MPRTRSSKKKMTRKELEEMRNLEKENARLDAIKYLHERTGPFKQLISENRYEEAFRSALRSSDYFMVTWLCNTVNLPSFLSRSPLPLTQPTLLRLLVGLSEYADMDSKVCKKLTWMTQVASAIDMDTSDPVIAKRMRAIFDIVFGNLDIFLEECPSEAGHIHGLIHVLKSISN